MKASAVVVASGRSTRTNGQDKNFFKVNDKYIVEYALDVFELIEDVDEIILVLNEKNYRFGEELLKKYKKLSLTYGGDFRALSVKNGIEKSKNEFVLVHDGARPFIKITLVKLILEELNSFSCVIPAVPVSETIKEVEEGFVKKTLDRKKLFEVQTPQGFRRVDLLELYRKFELNEAVYDESILFELANIPIKVVLGSFENFKITTPFDLFLAELLLRTWKSE